MRCAFRHEGLSPQLECYDMCRAGWDQYLPSLRDYLETGTGTPFCQAAGLVPLLRNGAARHSRILGDSA
ncbi:MAG: hypothetical protein M3Y33_09385 [Actinomycetota bacterium]|nr:hypothetical protein [Actinomycetota bacterium]